MKYHYSIITVIILNAALCGQAIAQEPKTPIEVQFNEAGQIISELPALVTHKDQISFSVIGTKENYEKRVLDAYTKYLETIKNLEKKTNKNYVLLKQVNLENNQDAIELLQAMQARMAKTLITFLNNSAPIDNKAILEKKRNIGDDLIKLGNYAKLATKPEIDNMLVPDIKDMIVPVYEVEYQYTGGMPTKEITCLEAISLKADPASCVWMFKSDKAISFSSTVTNFFKLGFKLRMKNSQYPLLNAQMNKIDALTVFVKSLDVEAQQRLLQNAFEGIWGADKSPAYELFKWLDDRLKNKEDYSQRAVLNRSVPQAEKTRIYNALTALEANQFAANLKNPKAIQFLLLLSWLNQGNNLSANPLISGLPTDFKGMIKAKNQELADSVLALEVINRRLGLVENVSKSGGQGCCGVPATTQLSKDYATLLRLHQNIVKAQVKLNEEIADLKEKQTKGNRTQLDTKKLILSDSLLYAGYFRVSIEKATVNQKDYHFMRNHNALNDYSHFDLKIQKEINEDQFMEAIAINQDPNSKILVKFTFSAPDNELDFISHNVGVSLAASVDRGKASIEDIYDVYKRIHDVFIPYLNGVISLPLGNITDESPDYISKTNVTPDPDQIPAKGQYAFLDSASSRNLNAQSAAFAFRVNKLYRFRLKAGLAYSFLERRNYTIGSNNAATYTTDYTSIAPVFGVQIFTAALDIQKKNFLPTKWAPYFYVGYMFNDISANNFLLGAGWELFSGIGLTGGVHLGKSQRLTTEQGNLRTKDYYKPAPFISLSFGLEAFQAIFNSAKSITNPFTK